MLILFMAKPRDELWRVGCDKVCAAPLELVIEQHFGGRTVNFEFLSENHKAKFEDEVLPVIKDAIDKAGCTLICSVSANWTRL